MARDMYREFPDEDPSEDLENGAATTRSASSSDRSSDDDDNHEESRAWTERKLFHVEEALRKTLAKALTPEEDKLRPPEPIPGNIYKFFAFVQFGYKKQVVADGATLFNPPETRFQQVLVMAGLFFITLIQTFGPIAILATKAPDLYALWSPGYYKQMTYSQWIILLLVWAFLFCFILNVYMDTVNETKLTEQICNLATGLKRLGHNVWPSMLIIDAAVNSFAGIALSLSLFVILFQETEAAGVVFDAMSLAFLLNIDDLGSDFGFLGAIWDDVKVGTFYKSLEDQGFFTKSEKHKEGGIGDDDILNTVKKSAAMMEHQAENVFYKVPRNIYKCTQCILLLLLFFATFTPLLFKNEAASKDFFKALNIVKNLPTTTPAEL